MLNGGGRAAVYNTFRKPTQITKTLYVGNVEFIQEDAGPVKTKRYIGGSMVVTDFNGTHEEHALFTDHLGSTVAMAKANSLDFNQEDYDAFGKRRNLWTANELVAADKATLNKLSTKGFTGHEMLDEVGLIHMKGRVYDPNLGRFLSADPFITELDNTQNMNRYSYVYNNPLTLIDLSGFAPTDYVGNDTYSPSSGPGSVGGTGGVPGLGQPGVSVVDCGGGCNIFGSVSIPDNSGIMNAALSGYALQMIMQQEAIQAQKALDIANATVQQILNQMRGISLSIAGVPAESIQKILANGTTVTPSNSQMELSANGFEYMKKVEGFDKTVKPDIAGNPTIGHGHKLTPGEIVNDTYKNGIDLVQADSLLKSDLSAAVADVNTWVKVDLAANQFDALVALRFRVGPIMGSYDLIDAINAKDFDKALVDWSNINKFTDPETKLLVESRGLTNRMNAEMRLFGEGIY